MKKTTLALFIIGALAVSVALAIFVSPYASSFPDGLERVAENLGFIEHAAQEGAWTKSPMPDYSAPGVRNDRLSTALAGLIGTVVVFIVGWALARLIRKRNAAENPISGGGAAA